MLDSTFDLFIIGGGINGAGIAADAAGRGLKVALCEQEDLASGTSCKSSKLIHGGLRYLEYYEFKLVRAALQEREILLKKAPHLIQPLTFVMPHAKHLRPAWLICCGLFLYDHLAKRTILPKSQKINLTQHPAGKPLKKQFQIGFTYADCYVNDARLVILNALQAKQFGAVILPRHKFLSAQRYPDYWQVVLQNTLTQQRQTLETRVLINAAGPWVNQVQQQLPVTTAEQAILVKGSHIVVPKLYEGEQAYILQNPDKRMVFVIPFQSEYSLIGTTDIPFQGDLNNLKITAEEITYLCQTVNQYLKQAVTSNTIVWSYAGVRALKQDKANTLAEISRDYDLELNSEKNMAPLLTVFGGKITTYRQLAEQTLQKLAPFFPTAKPAWTATKPLPGGDIKAADFNSFLQVLIQQYAFLPESLMQRYAKNYGTRVHDLLAGIQAISDLGQHFGADLYQREVDYLRQNEWAQTADDILWRRTQLGLYFTTHEVEKLEDWLLSSAKK